jgi:hypothetical protein
MTTSKKINKLPYQHVRITWWDIQQSNEAWIDEDDVLKKRHSCLPRHWLHL